jgi:hypothetical protein
MNKMALGVSIGFAAGAVLGSIIGIMIRDLHLDYPSVLAWGLY